MLDADEMRGESTYGAGAVTAGGDAVEKPYRTKHNARNVCAQPARWRRFHSSKSGGAGSLAIAGSPRPNW
jgi:hypothetical protein